MRLVVAITAAGEKAIGSTAAMERTAQTSPYYAAWVARVDRDLADARAAIAARDLAALGAVAERSALRMHASALAADPPILYWNPATIAAMATRPRRCAQRHRRPSSPSTPARTSRCCARRRRSRRGGGAGRRARRAATSCVPAPGRGARILQRRTECGGERQTLRGHPGGLAPGKMFLVGEYAVLEGGPAVLAAVTRHAVGQFIPGSTPARRGSRSGSAGRAEAEKPQLRCRPAPCW